MSSTKPLLIDHASFVYPIYGIFYFCAHPYLWPLFRARLLSICLLSLFIFVPLLLFTYLPQAAFLAIFNGRRFALINAFVLVLGETAAVVGLLFEAFFVDETLVDVFDAVLVGRGFEDLVATSRTVAPDPAQQDIPVDALNSIVRHRNPLKRLGRPFRSAVYSPFSLRQIVEFVLLLPLNMIPVGGTPAFMILTGYRAGPLQHYRYFEFLGLSKKERKVFVKSKRLRYTWFGTMALVLQLVPVLQMFFLLTTACGSALWAIDMEKKRRWLLAAEQSSSRDHYQDDVS